MWLLAGAAVLAGGCRGPDRALEAYGKVYYLDGGGNWGFGVTDVPTGLRRAGYKGDCEVFNWSHTFNPALDQVNTVGARISARELARKIIEYKQRHPEEKVNIIALSAGTGVAAWALEYLGGRPQVNNVFFLGSSLSNGYEMRRALRSVGGKLYNYFSPHDKVLQFVQVGVGTIDRKLGVEAAGQVGLADGERFGEKVVNIGWDKKYRRLGWNGAHTDYVNHRFIQYEVARKLMEGDAEPQAFRMPVGGRGREKPDAPAEGEQE